jgi:hypothetical protein
MHDQLLERAVNADDYVECHPCDCKPSRPAFAAQHVSASYDGEDLNDRNPNNIVLKRVLYFVLAKVKCESGYAGDDVNATNDDDSDRPLVHGLML